jgi:hypothetical protein
MRILAITSKFSGVGYHRIMLPLVNMEKDYCFITDTLSEEIIDNNYDLFIVNRYLSNIELGNILVWREKYGFKFIVDNDDYWDLDVHHPLYERYILNDIPNKIKQYITHADLCTCTHERLADEIYKYNSNVHILPNALPYGEEQFQDNKVESDKVRLFWSGSGTHEKDIMLLKRPIQRLTNLPIKQVIAGYNETEKPVWDKMISAFTYSFKLDSTIYNYNEIQKYMSAYADSDISLIPLLDTKFNSMKSNLKVLETASKKNPAIVSHVNPYLDLPVHYVKKQSDWFKHIRDLTYDHDMRKESGEVLFHHCSKYFNFKEINTRRKDIYKQIL